MNRYRWNTAAEWLIYKVANKWSTYEIIDAFNDLLKKTKPTDNDIESIFQEEMDEDGYFDPR